MWGQQTVWGKYTNTYYWGGSYSYTCEHHWQALLKYPALTAQVTYLSDKEIHWKTTDDKGQVAEQTNALTLKSINTTQYFLSWVEDDGTTVSQVIDTKKGTVTAFLTYEEGGKRVSQFLEGTFQLNK